MDRIQDYQNTRGANSERFFDGKYSKESEVASRRRYSMERILGLTKKQLPAIRIEVRSMAALCELLNPHMSKQDISYKVGDKLINHSAIKAGAVGSVTSVPAAIPGIGTMGTVLLGLAVDVTYLLKTQVRLCFAMSAAHEVEIEPEELNAVTMALLGFSRPEELADRIAASSLKAFEYSAAAKLLGKGLSKIMVRVSPRVTPRVLVRTFKLLPIINIPFGAALNAASTLKVGHRARRYFSAIAAEN